ncbi:MAG: hypothetical protein JWN70_1098 [Planctomycetaceae bacterium]|nr:hypothetical protein [Planctomycetaceae bacterium]
MNKLLAYGAIWGLASVLFLWGALQQGHRVNTDRHASDQSAYLGHARQLAETNFAAVGDRARMPIYPAVMAFLYRPGLTEDEFFARGKLAGIALAALVAALAAGLFQYHGQVWDTTAATLVAMLTMLAYKAPYCQADVLFYGLSCLLFCLLLSLLDTPRWTTAALAGGVGGLAYLTKASVLPAMGLALGLLLIRGCVVWYQQCRQGRPPPGRSGRRQFAIHLGCASLVLGCFLLVVFPYIRTSHERFGHYFYNVNSTFYVWYDSWDEVKAGTRAHGDRVGWPDLPPDQIPSLTKYLREHTAQQALTRLARGLVRYTLLVCVYSYGYAEFALLYFALLGVLFWQNRRGLDLWQEWHRHGSAVLFVGLYFGGYLLLYAWFAPVSTGHRFVLTLYLPALWLAVRGLLYAQHQRWALQLFRGRAIAASAISPLMLIALAGYALLIFPQRIGTVYGGG